MASRPNLSSPRPAGPGQEEMFPIEEVAPIAPESTPTSQVESIDLDVPGVATDLMFRAYEFGSAMKSMNLANSRAGMQAAASTKLYRPKLEAAYGSKLDDTLKRGQWTESKEVKKAKENIDALARPKALIRAGFDEKEVWDMTRGMKDKMLSRYGVGIANADIRNKAAKVVLKTAQNGRGTAKRTRKAS